jgi:uncharacterized protein
MTALAERLQKLRAQAGAVALPLRFATELGRPDANSLGLRQLLARHRPQVATPHSSDRTLPGAEIAPGLRYVETPCPWLPDPGPIDTRFASKLAMGEVIEARQVLAFDTETTGLSGGSGTRAFRQLFITTLAAEAAMLRAFASWLDPAHVLVSYNGRSYDAPLLATRYRLARVANPLAQLSHLDLLHPTRRRYKGVFENCRLATIERHVLDVLREDDLPGAEAPAAWLTWLRGGSAANLRRVVTHNATDLSSLAALLLRLAA